MATTPAVGASTLVRATTLGPGTVVRLPSAPAGVHVPADGRLRGDGFAANVIGVGAGPAAAALRAGPGQRLWAFGINGTVTTPAAGGSVAALTVTLAAGDDQVPVPLPSPGSDGGFGPSWYLASLPAASDVTLTLTAGQSTQTFSLTRMAREGTGPNVSYRDPSSSTVAADAGGEVDLPEDYANPSLGADDTTTADPLHIKLVSAVLGADAPDRPGHVVTEPTQAFLTVRLQSDLPEQATSEAFAFLVFGQAVSSGAVTLTVPGSATQTSALVPGGGGDNPTTFAANLEPGGDPVSEAQPPPWGAFPDTYYFTVPADLTSATITVTPGPLTAIDNHDPTSGTATPEQGDSATLAVTLPAITPYAPPPGVSSQPGLLTASASSSGQSGGSDRTTIPIILGLAAVAVVALARFLLRRRRLLAPAAGRLSSELAWTAPAAAAPWPDPAPPPATTPAEPPPPVPTPEPIVEPDPPAVAELVPDPTPAPSEFPAPEPAAVTPPPPPPPLPHRLPPTPAILPRPAIRIYRPDPLQGWDQPPDAANLIELAIYLAIQRRAVPTESLRHQLTGRGGPLEPETIRSYCSRLRRNHLDGTDAELVNSPRGYELRGVATDIGALVDATRQARQNSGPGSIEQLAAALALVEGPPLAGTDYRWTIEADLTTPVRDAALLLADLTAATDPHLALWGCQQTYPVAVDQSVIAAALTAAAATESPGLLTDVWHDACRRLDASDVPIDPGLDAHYRWLRHPDPPKVP